MSKTDQVVCRYPAGMAIDLRLMRYVIAVAEEGGFQRAAERLVMAQPPLSRQIRDLERELGVTLFERQPAVRLTEAGRVFVDSARTILAEADRLVERTVLAGRGEYGSIRVGYIYSAVFDTLPRLVEAMSKSHPGVTVDVGDGWTPELDAALLAGAYDLVLFARYAASSRIPAQNAAPRRRRRGCRRRPSSGRLREGRTGGLRWTAVLSPSSPPRPWPRRFHDDRPGADRGDFRTMGEPHPRPGPSRLERREQLRPRRGQRGWPGPGRNRDHRHQRRPPGPGIADGLETRQHLGHP